MATLRRRGTTRKPPSKRITSALARSYAKANRECLSAEQQRLKLAKKIFDLARTADHARIHVDIHRTDGKRVERKTYKLSDPQASLLLLNQFCNVWIPVGNLFCIAKFGCAATLPPPPGFWLGCALMGCFVNVCPAPGAALVMCVYVCV